MIKNKPTSQEFIQKNLNQFWQKKLYNFATANTVLIGQVDDLGNSIPVEHFHITMNMDKDGVASDFISTYKIEKNVIIGYIFTNKTAADNFKKWAKDSALFNLIIITPPSMDIFTFHLNAVPPGLTKDILQKQLINHGLVNNFGYLKDKESYLERITTNAVSFQLTLKKNADWNEIPTHVHFKGFSILLSNSALPTPCTMCRMRGHHASACNLTYCATCQARCPRGHICTSRVQQDWVEQVEQHLKNTKEGQESDTEEEENASTSSKVFKDKESERRSIKTQSTIKPTVQNTVKIQKNSSAGITKIKKPVIVGQAGENPTISDSDSDTSDLMVFKAASIKRKSISSTTPQSDDEGVQARVPIKKKQPEANKKTKNSGIPRRN